MTAREALHSSKSIEWYTPAKYIEAARKVMGWINLDPASNEEANKIVQAQHYLSLEHSGLLVPWYGKVWLNPPYGRQTGLWVNRLIDEYTCYRVSEAILLINAATDRQWFAKLWNFPICFTNHRIRFTPPQGIKATRPTNGSAFVYFGKTPQVFISEFCKFGSVVRKYEQC